MKKDQMMEKVMSFAMKVQQNKYLSAISTGLMGTLPILMIGSIALLLAVLPIDAYKEFITNIGLRSFLMLTSTLTTSIIALYSSFAIAYRLAEKFKVEPMIPGVLAVRFVYRNDCFFNFLSSILLLYGRQKTDN